MRALRYAGLFTTILLIATFVYGAKGFMDALSDAHELRVRADKLIANERGGASLGAEHLAILLLVEDPSFTKHNGVDLSSPGAGLTTITQSASKRLAFDKFRPGIGKVRQTGYALGLERRLSKDQILALWLDTLEMGRGPNGWMNGFYTASSTIYGRQPRELSKKEFVRLVAVLIAPAKYNLAQSDAALDERVRRIERLASGTCEPVGVTDVWLESCSS